MPNKPKLLGQPNERLTPEAVELPSGAELVDHSDESLDMLSESPIPGSREVIYLCHLLGRMNNQLDNDSLLQIKNPEVSKGNFKPTFFEAGQVIMDIDTSDKSCIKIHQGSAVIWIKGEGEEFIPVCEVGGISLGGGERWLDFSNLPKGMIRVTAGSDLISPSKSMSKAEGRMSYLNFANFLDELSYEDRNERSYLLKLFGQLRERYPKVFRYRKDANYFLQPELVINDNPQLKGDSDFNEFSRAMKIFYCRFIKRESGYRRGVEIEYVSAAQHEESNMTIMWPALANEVRRLQSKIPQEAFSALVQETASYLKENFKTNDGKSLSMNFDAHNLINHPPDSTFGHAHQLADLKIDLLSMEAQFLLFLKSHPNDALLTHFTALDQEGIDLATSSLLSKGLIQESKGEYFLTLKGAKYAEEIAPDLEKENTNEYLFEQYIDKGDYFFAIQLGEKNPEIFSSYLIENPQQALYLLKDILQVPHSKMPSDLQSWALQQFEYIYNNNTEALQRIRYSQIIMLHLRRTRRDFEEVISQIENYLQESSIDPEEMDKGQIYTGLIFIYLEALEVLGMWDKIQSFTKNKTHFPDFTDIPNYQPQKGMRGFLKKILGKEKKEKVAHLERQVGLKVYQMEKEWWLRTAGLRAEIMSSTEDHLVADKAYKEAKKLEEEIEMIGFRLTPLTRVRIYLDLQRLYRMANESQDESIKKEAHKRTIEIGELLEDSEVNPIFMQPIWSNMSVVYRDQKQYKQALQYFDKAALDSRGVSRQLMNSSVVLEQVLEEFKEALNTEDLDQIKVSTQLLIDVLNFLTVESDLVPDALRKTTTSLIADINDEKLNGGLIPLLKERRLEIDLIVQHVGYSLNVVALSNTGKSPYELCIAHANCCDGLMEMRSTILEEERGLKKQQGEEAELPNEVNVFREASDINNIYAAYMNTVKVFDENFFETYAKTPPMHVILRDYLMVHGIRLTSWISTYIRSNTEEGSVDRRVWEDKLYEMQCCLANYSPIIERELAKFNEGGKGASKLFPEGVPEGPEYKDLKRYKALMGKYARQMKKYKKERGIED